MAHAGTEPGKITLTTEEQRILDQTVEEINRGQFFEAHETLELTWAQCREHKRVFLQAVIHVAVGAYHASRGNRTGMERQFVKARRKLAPFLPSCAGIDTQALTATLDGLLQPRPAGEDQAISIPLPLVRCSRREAGAGSGSRQQQAK